MNNLENLPDILLMPIDKSQEAAWRAMQDHNGKKRGNDGTGSSGGEGGKPTDVFGMKDYVDAKVETLEHKLMSRLDQLATKATIWGAVAIAIAILLAVLAFGGGRFDAGMSVGNQKLEQLKRDDQQDAAVRKINEKLDQILIVQHQKN